MVEGWGVARGAANSGPGEKKVNTGAGGGRIAEDQEAEGLLFSLRRYLLSVTCWGRGADLKRVAGLGTE